MTFPKTDRPTLCWRIVGVERCSRPPGATARLSSWLDGWHRIRVLNHFRDGRRLVLVAREAEKDCSTFYTIGVLHDADLVKLEDAHATVANAAFIRDDRDISYAATTSEHPDQVEIRWVPTDSSWSFEIPTRELLGRRERAPCTHSVESIGGRSKAERSRATPGSG